MRSSTQKRLKASSILVASALILLTILPIIRLPLARALPVTASVDVTDVNSDGFLDVVFKATGPTQIVITEKGSSVDNYVISRSTDPAGNLVIHTFPAGSYDYYIGSEYQGSFDVAAPRFCNEDNVTSDCTVVEKTGEDLLTLLLTKLFVKNAGPDAKGLALLAGLQQLTGFPTSPPVFIGGPSVSAGNLDRTRAYLDWTGQLDEYVSANFATDFARVIREILAPTRSLAMHFARFPSSEGQLNVVIDPDGLELDSTTVFSSVTGALAGIGKYSRIALAADIIFTIADLWNVVSEGQITFTLGNSLIPDPSPQAIHLLADGLSLFTDALGAYLFVYAHIAGLTTDAILQTTAGKIFAGLAVVIAGYFFVSDVLDLTNEINKNGGISSLVTSRVVQLNLLKTIASGLVFGASALTLGVALGVLGATAVLAAMLLGVAAIIIIVGIVLWNRFVEVPKELDQVRTQMGGFLTQMMQLKSALDNMQEGSPAVFAAQHEAIATLFGEFASSVKLATAKDMLLSTQSYFSTLGTAETDMGQKLDSASDSLNSMLTTSLDYKGSSDFLQCSSGCNVEGTIDGFNSTLAEYGGQSQTLSHAYNATLFTDCLSNCFSSQYSYYRENLITASNGKLDITPLVWLVDPSTTTLPSFVLDWAKKTPQTGPVIPVYRFPSSSGNSHFIFYDSTGSPVSSDDQQDFSKNSKLTLGQANSIPAYFQYKFDFISGTNYDFSSGDVLRREEWLNKINSIANDPESPSCPTCGLKAKMDALRQSAASYRAALLANKASLTEWKLSSLVYTDCSGSVGNIISQPPTGISVDSTGVTGYPTGSIWVVHDSYNNRLTNFDPNTGTFYSYSVTSPGAILVPGPLDVAINNVTGEVWGSTVNQNSLYRKPSGTGTQTFRIWNPSGVAGIILDSVGRPYFAQPNAYSISLLDTPTTMETWSLTFTLSKSVVSNVSPYYLATDDSGEIWFTGQYPLLGGLLSGGTIGRLNVQTNTVTEWPLPSLFALPLAIKIDSHGSVWFTDNDNEIVRLDPSKNEMTEYTDAGLVGPRYLSVSELGHIFFTAGDRTVGILDPLSSSSTSQVDPVNTVVQPLEESINYEDSPITPCKTVISPRQTSLSAVSSSGSFAFLALPDLGSSPMGITGIINATRSGGTLYFNELAGIGRLQTSMLGSSMEVSLDSSTAQLLVTDQSGRRVGADGFTNVNDIATATYSGAGVNPQVVGLSNPETALYKILVTSGAGTEEYTLTVKSSIGPVELSITGSVSPGLSVLYSLDASVSPPRLAIANQPPIADPGPDIIIEGNANGGANVRFDGSKSHDPDGDALTYSWSGDCGTATDPSPILFCPWKTTSNMVRLVVNDGKVDSNPAFDRVTVTDTTPPIITASRNPAANRFGWNNRTVTVSFQCSDLVSGADPASLSGPVILSQEGRNQTATGSCKDRAGNTNSTNVTGINIDKTPPYATGCAVTPPANQNGWHNTDVTIECIFKDDLSGIPDDIVCVQVIGVVCPGPVVIATIGTEGRDQSVTLCTFDRAGNKGCTTVGGINIDKTPPVITSPQDGQSFILRQTVLGNATCADALSGIDTCVVPAFVDTSTVGSHSYLVTSSDFAGNPATFAVHYNVHYVFIQVSPKPTETRFSLGATIPVRFQLKDALGNNVFTAAAQIWVDSLTTPAKCSGSSNTGNYFRYDSTERQYVFNLSTKGMTAGQHNIYITLDDGTVHTMTFMLTT